MPSAILSIAFLLFGNAGAGGTNVIFDGKAIAASAIPETVNMGVRDAAAKLEPWAEKYQIHLHVAAGDPLLLAIPSSLTTAGQILKKLRETREDFTTRYESKLPADAALEMIYVDKQPAFAAYVDLLVSREDYLKNWAAGAKETAGFWLHRPFAAAYFRDPKDPKEKKAEFNLNNQLIHQFAHLLVNAAYGRQPYWIQESIAWSLEQARENQIYSFCHRSGFVFKKEHGGWPKLGKQYLLATKTPPMDKIFAMDREMDIPRELGAGAMVLVDLLVSKHKESFQKLVASFKADIEAKLTEPGYKIPLDKQREYYKNAMGDGASKLQEELSAK